MLQDWEQEWEGDLLEVLFLEQLEALLVVLSEGLEIHGFTGETLGKV